ncbi:MAG: MarR family transcriptional regulator [Halobacteriales archaeon]|nr:MarR family transcriptional regulator [Halobacteriales archaeon]
MENVAVYRCGGCDGLVLVSEEGSAGSCCGEDLEKVREDDIQTKVHDPDADDVLRDIFGLGETSLNICFCVIDREGATVSEVADEMGIDRSAVSRHMKSLVESGILRREEKNLKQGGVVHVYTHENPEDVKERLAAGAFFWTSKVVELVNELNDEKMEAMMEENADVAEVLGGKIWMD